MLVLDILGQMSTNDLCQRYQNSWIKYANQVVWCNDFTVDDSGFQYIQFNIPRNEFKEGFGTIVKERFDYTLLDTQRPRSRWYVQNNQAIFLGLSVEKQYCRGVNENTCWLFTPPGALKQGHEYLLSYFIQTFLDEKNQKTDWKIRRPVEEIIAEVKDKKVVMLSPLLVILPNGDVYYRTTLVGSFTTEVLELTRRFISAELKECCLGINIVFRG